jgi:hypothetical protein
LLARSPGNPSLQLVLARSLGTRSLRVSATKSSKRAASTEAEREQARGLHHRDAGLRPVDWNRY